MNFYNKLYLILVSLLRKHDKIEQNRESVDIDSVEELEEQINPISPLMHSNPSKC